MSPSRKIALRAGIASFVVLCLGVAVWATVLTLRAPSASSPEIVIPGGHVRYVSGVSWSPDGRWVASASWDRTVRVMDAANGRVVRVLTGQSGRVNAVAWHPSDIRKLLAAGDDGTIRVWIPLEGTLTSSLNAGSVGVLAVAWSPDGGLAAGASRDGSVVVWQPAGEQSPLRFQAHDAPIRTIAFQPSGRLLLTGSEDKTARLWDVSTGQAAGPPLDHPHSVTSVAWDSVGRQLATSCWDGQVRVWTAEGQFARAYTGHSHVVTQVTWSPDGSSLATSSLDRSLRVWAASGEVRLELKDQRSPLTSVAWNPDGTRLASGGENQSVAVWNASSGTVLSQAQGSAQLVASVSWSPDGAYFATATRDSIVRLWDASTGAPVRDLTNQRGAVTSVAWSPDSRSIAVTGFDNAVHSYEVATGRFIGAFRAHTDAVFAMAYHPRGGRLATASDDGFVKIWDMENQRPIRELSGDGRGAVALAWSPDGSWLAAGGDDKAVRIWHESASTGARTLTGHEGSVTSLSFSPDGTQLASASLDRTVRLWRAADGALVETYEEHSELVTAVGWSPDGRILASCGFDGTVRLRDLSSGTSRVLEGRGGELMSLSWNRDGSAIAASGYEGFVDFWDSASGDHRFVLAILRGGEWLLYDARRLVYTASERGDETAFLRFSRLLDPLYPLAYYRGELIRPNVFAGNGRPASPAPAPIRLAWEGIPGKQAWILGLFAGYGLAGGAVYWFTRGGSRLTGVAEFFVQAGFRSARIVDGRLLRLTPAESELPGLAAAWEPGDGSVIESLQSAWSAFRKSAGDTAPSSFRCYLLTDDPLGSRADIQRVRREVPGIVVPLRPLSLQRAKVTGSAKAMLRACERPYPALADPYADLGPVTDPAWFFGRDGLLESLTAEVESGRHMLIRGWRKSGRTSLARQLQSRPERPCAWVAVRELEGPLLPSVLAAVHQELQARNFGLPRTSGGDFGAAFGRLHRAFADAGGTGPVAVVLDDAERVLEECAPLFDFPGRLVVVAVTFRAGAPPAFSELPVQAFEPEGIAQMVTECGQWKDIRWTPEAVRQIGALSGGDPSVARFLASDASKQGFRKSVDEEMVARVTEEALQSIEKNRIGQYFRTHIWEPARESERDVLVHAAKRQAQEGHEALAVLEGFGLLKDGGVRCPLLESWLCLR